MVKNRGGFTLFEVMITMAVSGSMLVMAIILFGGQQRKTQFNQSLRDIESKVQDIINDTATGYFPSSTYTCASGTAGISGPTFTAGAASQGSSNGCVFLGKVIHIKRDKLNIYSAIGNSNISATTFASAMPVVPVDSSGVAIPDLVDTKDYLWGLSAYRVVWEGPGATTVDKNADGRLIAIVSTPNGTGMTGGNLNSGVQRINTYTSGTSATTSIGDTNSVADITGVLQLSNFSNWVPIGDKVTICFEDVPSSTPGRQIGGVVVSGGSTSIGVRLQTDTDTARCT